MNFVNTKYLPHIIIGIIVFTILLSYLNFKFYSWIKTYWFFERTWWSRFSSVIYVISIAMMLLSLLDLRGPEQKIKSNIPDQKTIIIIDSSASMLAEDIRPSRFVKSLQLARHFVKNAAGHQISIVLFSDIQKRLIPFTDDIDLLDSRLAALEKTNAVSGGSNISQAIEEAIQYFNNGDEEQASLGNILLFTDAEESDGKIDLELSNNFNLAVVGVGTAKGGNIPLRWEDGSFKGYKNFNGEPVITKLNEDYIKSIGKDVKNYKYWIANSYSLPTDEILNFFRTTFDKKTNKGDLRVRPVFSHYILIPAIILYCFSVLLGRFATLKSLNSILIMLCLTGLFFKNIPAMANEDEQPKEIPPQLKLELDKMKKGKSSRSEVLKLAEKFLRAEDLPRANELYQEYLRASDDDEVKFNYATTLLKSGQLDQAMPIVQNLLNKSTNESLKEKLRNNVLLAINNSGSSKNKKNDQNQKQNQNQEDKNKESQNKDNKNDKDKDKDKGKEGNNSKEKDSQKTGDKQNKSEDKNEEKEKDKKDPKDLEKPEQQKPQTLEEREKMIEQKRKMVKTPAMIKQILSDDRELQKKMMDTSTNKRRDQRPERDW